MGAFFLYPKNANTNLERVKQLFHKKGFSAPYTFDLRSHHLWLYSKIMLGEQNFEKDNNDNYIFSIGTYIYKGKLPQESRVLMLEDFISNKLDTSQLIGSYCIIFFVKNKISLLHDPQQLYQIYYHKKNHCISSSFLALLSGSEGKLNVDKEAIISNIMCGFIPHPNTLVHEIKRINKTTRFSSVSIMKQTHFSNFKNSIKGFSQHVKHQNETIANYFKQISSLAKEKGVEIGLSGGFDSRLLLLHTCKITDNIHTHTHFKKNDPDPFIAEKIANTLHIPFSKPNTLFSHEMSNELLCNTMQEVLHLFDGRICSMMQYLRQEYTLSYRRKHFENKGLVLSGVGGEVYRNYLSAPQNTLGLRKWITSYLIPRVFLDTLEKTKANNLINYLSSFLKEDIPLKDLDRITFNEAKQFYAKIWLRDWHGLRNSAENQLYYHLSPFAESNIAQESLKSVRYHGKAGEFEAAMIKALDQKVAQIPSSYGYSFNHIPLKTKLIDALKTYTPLAIRNIFSVLKQHKQKKTLDPTTKLLLKKPVIKESYDALNMLELGIDWEKLFINYEKFVLAISIGFFIDMFKSYLSFSQYEPTDQKTYQ